MKKILSLIFSLLLVLGLGATASAYYVFDLGGGSYMDGAAFSDPGLVMQYSLNPNLDSLIYGLNNGESVSFWFATLWTNEDFVNDDDRVPQAINAYVDFDNPDLVAHLQGSTVAFTAWWGFQDGWSLTWNGSQTISFGSGGQFTISLSNVRTIDWAICDPVGTSANIYATLTLNSTPVPLPGAVWLLGSGVIALVGFRRRLKI
ncbi:MAG: VPLPA-CTERM sorting domain-containing protein [Thermodesulfobacteriota bacterium]